MFTKCEQLVRAYFVILSRLQNVSPNSPSQDLLQTVRIVLVSGLRQKYMHLTC
jgi:hypothetical protein